MEKELQLAVTVLIELTREVRDLLSSFLQAADRIPLWPEHPAVPAIPEGSPEEAAAVNEILVKAGIKKPDAEPTPAPTPKRRATRGKAGSTTEPGAPESTPTPDTPETGKPTPAPNTFETGKPTPAPAVPAPSYEEVRERLTEKSRDGYKAEVKALLTRHGLERLGDVKNTATPEETETLLRNLYQEAEAIGNA